MQLGWAGTSRRSRVAGFLAAGVILLAFHSAALLYKLQEPLVLAAYVLNGHMSPWIVGGLASALMWSKKDELWNGMAHNGITWPYAGVGVVIIGISTLLPFYAAIILGMFGVFCMLFGRAAVMIMPGILAYAVVLLYPAMVDTYAQVGYADTVLGPVAWMVQLLGVPAGISGTSVSLALPGSQELRLGVVADCAGPTSMALFLSIFILMFAHRQIPWRTGLMVLLVGVTGTWLQNVVRVLSVLVVGNRFGEDALWSAHEYLSYIVFPGWYLVFTMFYVSVANKTQTDVSYKLSLV